MTMERIDLNGTRWALCADPAPCRYDSPPADFPLTMTLPGTTAQQGIGTPNTAREEGFFTEKYPFSGRIWLKTTVRLTAAQARMPHCFLHLERTRMTRLWVNGAELGSENSLCTPHFYDLSGRMTPVTELILCVQNFGYPTAGGHMTSPDTQTNWIGVTGRIDLEFHENAYISELRAFPSAEKRRLTLTGHLSGGASAAVLAVQPVGGHEVLARQTVNLSAGNFSVTVPLPVQLPLWSDSAPNLLRVSLHLANRESAETVFGLRDFAACGDHFEINGVPVMLRGRHDALVFPRTGAAPTALEPWLERFREMKNWGLNHVRFHTCCPPDAAFLAADLTGFYLEPELPFWGTVDAPGGEKYSADEQAYLIREGLRICAAFGSHPSFCMFSLGNELWGSKERLGEIIDTLRDADPRPLYTQGSNNFQHMPVQIPQEDFWTGVRTGQGRLIRGSFADCDAPIGRIQTHAPAADWNYEEYLTESNETDADAEKTEISIQYGTGVRTVRAERQGALVPTVPVVTHEIGQYGVFPDFQEIPFYQENAVVEARSFEIFRERLEAAGMGGQAAQFFRCSGALSRDCYKAEIEAAMRSPHIAGFQLLDLQDFPGQGTALVGMLNADFQNKGLISPDVWRGFCGDLVPLAEFHCFVQTAGTSFPVRLSVRSSREHVTAQPYRLTVTCGTRILHDETRELPALTPGYHVLTDTEITLPADCTGRLLMTLTVPGEQVRNAWTLTAFPPVTPVKIPADMTVTKSREEALAALQSGRRVLLLEQPADGIRGFYCADFWNYHMFRIISESMGRQVPVGTMGLCTDTAHPAVRALFSAGYTEPQWYDMLTHADCAVLDGREDCELAVQMIDNTERCHRLGLLWEEDTPFGRMTVCTVRFDEIPDDPAANALLHALLT